MAIINTPIMPIVIIDRPIIPITIIESLITPIVIIDNPITTLIVIMGITDGKTGVNGVADMVITIVEVDGGIAADDKYAGL